MKHIRPLNETALRLISRGEPDVYGHACTSCCPDYWPGWELGNDGKIDPCPWDQDYNACDNPVCAWTSQVPDTP